MAKSRSAWSNPKIKEPEVKNNFPGFAREFPSEKSCAVDLDRSMSLQRRPRCPNKTCRKLQRGRPRAESEYRCSYCGQKYTHIVTPAVCPSPGCKNAGAVKKTKSDEFICKKCGSSFTRLGRTLIRDSNLSLRQWYLSCFLFAEMEGKLSHGILKQYLGIKNPRSSYKLIELLTELIPPPERRLCNLLFFFTIRKRANGKGKTKRYVGCVGLKVNYERHRASRVFLKFSGTSLNIREWVGQCYSLFNGYSVIADDLAGSVVASSCDEFQGLADGEDLDEGESRPVGMFANTRLVLKKVIKSELEIVELWLKSKTKNAPSDRFTFYLSQLERLYPFVGNKGGLFREMVRRIAVPVEDLDQRLLDF